MLSKRLVFVFVLLILVIGAISTVNANDITDDTIGDADDDKIEIIDEEVSDDENSLEIAESDSVSSNGNEDVLAATGTFQQLKDKIDQGYNGAISLDCDYAYSGGYNGGEGVYISNSITIDGKGHSIDGLSQSRLIFINPYSGYNPTIELKNIVFKNGFAEFGGGVVAANSVRVIFTNCQFIGNKATEQGGAVYTQVDSTNTFRTCTFTNNSAPYGGGVYSARTSVSLQQCTFNSNTATGSGGGKVEEEYIHTKPLLH